MCFVGPLRQGSFFNEKNVLSSVSSPYSAELGHRDKRIKKASDASKNNTIARSGTALYFDAASSKRVTSAPPPCTRSSFVVCSVAGKMHLLGWREHLEIKGWFENVNCHLVTLRDALGLVKNTPPRSLAQLLFDTGMSPVSTARALFFSQLLGF